MDFVFTQTFYASYESLTDDEVEPVDDAIRRLLVDHATAWARQGRIEGEMGGAWILVVRSPSIETSLYWDYHDEENLVLLAMVASPI